MPNIVSQLKSLTFLLKWLELALAIVCIALLRNAVLFPSIDMDKIAVSYMTICGYILINTVMVIGFFKDEQMPKTLVRTIKKKRSPHTSVFLFTPILRSEVLIESRKKSKVT
ncbi:hypothetical protein J437_LFUL001231 [Ladona fulva]|uniref:Uncharacterized protein n=1 Tax=Ladona fulva TaxID=123851 RepID=A0A8K0NVI9_LADFU|nr:hypothetical protein J437_LFUL001231 [Ladona fulva]